MSIKEKIMLKASKVVGWTKYHSPELLMIGGTIAIGAGVVLLCKASREMDKDIEELKENLETVDKCEEGNEEHPENTLEHEKAKTLRRHSYVKCGIQLSKRFGPGVGLVVGGLGCFYYSHQIMSNRYAVLASAYTTLDSAFKAYRERIKEKIGEEAEWELYNMKKVVEDDEKTGFDLAEADPYTIIFDSTSKYWTKDPDKNMRFLRMVQSEMNDVLRFRGHVIMNEVLDKLGLPRTNAGMICGWVLGNGDDYVDLGLWDDEGKNYRFIAGQENVAILNLNCDGVIYDKIWTHHTFAQGGLWNMVR